MDDNSRTDQADEFDKARLLVYNKIKIMVYQKENMINHNGYDEVNQARKQLAEALRKYD